MKKAYDEISIQKQTQNEKKGPTVKVLITAWTTSLFVLVGYPMMVLMARYGYFFRFGSVADLLFLTLYLLSPLIIVLSIPFIYAAGNANLKLGRVVWLSAVASVLFFFYLLFLDRAGDPETVFFPLLSLWVLTFPACLIAYVTTGEIYPVTNGLTFLAYIGGIVITGFLQWFIVIPHLIEWSKKPKNRENRKEH